MSPKVSSHRFGVSKALCQGSISKKILLTFKDKTVAKLKNVVAK